MQQYLGKEREDDAPLYLYAHTGKNVFPCAASSKLWLGNELTLWSYFAVVFVAVNLLLITDAGIHCKAHLSLNQRNTEWGASAFPSLIMTHLSPYNSCFPALLHKCLGRGRLLSTLRGLVWLLRSQQENSHTVSSYRNWPSCAHIL